MELCRVNLWDWKESEIRLRSKEQVTSKGSQEQTVNITVEFATVRRIRESTQNKNNNWFVKNYPES